MFSTKMLTLMLSISSILLVTGQQIEYLNGLLENQDCTLNSGLLGRCRKISGCKEDFESHRRDKTVLKICSFASNAQNHLICCSQKFDSYGQILDQTTKSYQTIRPILTSKIERTTTRTDKTTTRQVRTTTRLFRTTSRLPQTTTTTAYRTTPRTLPTSSFYPSGSIDFREDRDEVSDIRNDPTQNEPSTTEQLDKDIDFINFESCQNGLLKYRTDWINTNHFGKAMADKVIPLTKEKCDLLNELNQQSGTTTRNNFSCRPARGRYFIIDNSRRRPEEPKVKEGFRPNMANIGWTDENGKSFYKCYGSIITVKFIVTAAHCRELEELPQPDTVRVGDRYLMSAQDDENAQQLKIQKFIVHPNFRPTLDYFDIAMIETVERMVFNNFVVPSCIGNLEDSENKDYTVSGYKDDGDGVLMNVLMEMKVEIIPNSECNKIYGKDQQLPRGIDSRQICVRSKTTRKEMQDTCFGESGSPLQFRSTHDIKLEEFGSYNVATSYETSTIIGIQSFSTSCALDIPSVYTRLDSYKDWMKTVIENSN